MTKIESVIPKMATKRRIILALIDLIFILQNISDTDDRMNQLLLEIFIDLLSQKFHVNIDDVRFHVEADIPNMLGNMNARKSLPPIAQEIFEKRKLP